MWDFEYEGTRRICYGKDGATFIPVCKKCGRFVKADKTVRFTESGDGPPAERPNATCSIHGRIKMIFEGFY